jgi:anti-sigma factor RsiW
MTKHLEAAWIAAYHDGELQGRRLRQAETHLARCVACWEELERLRGLSALLQMSPPASDLMPSERFVAQVGMQLPRRAESRQFVWQKVPRIGWWLAPLGLFAAWVFVRTMFIVTNLLLVALELGNSPGLTVLREFDRVGLGWSIVLNLALPLVIGLLYASWLAGWWVSRRSASSENGNRV